MKVFIGVFNKLSNIDKKGYYHIQLGGAINKKVAEMSDDEGENISNKNPNYCELTALYWMWKNVKEDIVGLVHYRRFFYKNSITLNKKNVLSEKDVNKYLENYDIIVSQKGWLGKTTVLEQYKEKHDVEDLEKCRKILEEKYPDYVEAFDKVFNSNMYSPFNMFIGKKEFVDQYSEWLFDVFNELEPMIDLEKKDKYNKRIYGFLSERLFNVWLEKNDLKIKYCPVYNVEDGWFKQIARAVVKKFIVR